MKFFNTRIKHLIFVLNKNVLLWLFIIDTFAKNKSPPPHTKNEFLQINIYL